MECNDRCYTPFSGRVASICCPRELRAALLDLYLCYMEQRPVNVLDFLIKYFENMKELCEHSKLGFVQNDIVNVEHIDVKDDYFTKRRNAVCLEPYVPQPLSEPEKKPLKYKCDRKKIRQSLQSIPFFEDLNETVMSALIHSFDLQDVKPGTIIDQDHFYIVDTGKFVSYTIKDGNVYVQKKYYPGNYFGENFLFEEEPKPLSIVSTVTGSLWKVHKKTFRCLLLDKQCALYTDYKAIFDQLEIFENISDQDKTILMEVVELKAFDKGDILFREGESADGIYIMLKGTVEIVTTTRGDNVTHVIQEGSYFGELSLIAPCKRIATARARTKVRALFLGTHVLQRFLPDCINAIHLHIYNTEGKRFGRHLVDLMIDDRF